VAIVAVAPKLLALIWTLLTRGEPYRAADLQRTQVKERRMEQRAAPYPVAQVVVLARKVEQLLAKEATNPVAELQGACAFS